MEQDDSQELCPCNGGQPMSMCCGPYFDILRIGTPPPGRETLLLEWPSRFAIPVVASFTEKTDVFVRRISWFLDQIVERYLFQGHKSIGTEQKTADKAFFAIKHNALLSLYASLSCLAQGLFVQSGVVLRSLVEDCFVLLDLAETSGQMEKFMQGKYSASNVLTRVKNLLPKEIVDHYGYFSANFAHFGPLHPAPYIPRACYPDNWVLVVGLENVVRAVLVMAVVFERVHFKEGSDAFVWKLGTAGAEPEFDESNRAFEWAAKLVRAIQSCFPVDERKDGFTYHPSGIRLK